MSSSDSSRSQLMSRLALLGADGSGSRVDATMLIDSSGSMASSDPQGLRVDGAKAFVAGMRDRDRAAVVSFESSATTRIGLTPLDTAANRQAVDDALEATRYAGGGTTSPRPSTGPSASSAPTRTPRSGSRCSLPTA